MNWLSTSFPIVLLLQAFLQHCFWICPVMEGFEYSLLEPRELFTSPNLLHLQSLSPDFQIIELQISFLTQTICSCRYLNILLSILINHNFHPKSPLSFASLHRSMRNFIRHLQFLHQPQLSIPCRILVTTKGDTLWSNFGAKEMLEKGHYLLAAKVNLLKTSTF